MCYCGSALWALIVLLSNWNFWAVMVKMEWNEIVHFYTYFFFLDSDNAILIRLSLKAAMGENAVSIIYY